MPLWDFGFGISDLGFRIWDFPQSAIHSLPSNTRQATAAELERVTSDVWMKPESRYPFPERDLQLVTTPDGNYYTFSGERPRAESSEPVQPKFRFTLGEVDRDGQLLDPRGVLFQRATYRDIPGFTPLIERAGILGVPDTRNAQPPPVFDAPNWYPSRPVSLRQVERTAGTGTVLFGRSEAQLLFYVGQYHAGLGTERLFDEIVLDEYYSVSEDRDAPTIESVEAQPVGGTTEVEVRAGDPSGVERVVTAYTDEQGSWESVDLTWNDTSGAWQGTIPVSGNLAFFVQAVDMAGNVAVDDNDGLYYGSCALIGDVSSDTPDLPDGIIDTYDVQAIAGRWRRREAEAGWDSRFDLDKNKTVNIVDIMREEAQWDDRCP